MGNHKHTHTLNLFQTHKHKLSSPRLLKHTLTHTEFSSDPHLHTYTCTRCTYGTPLYTITHNTHTEFSSGPHKHTHSSPRLLKQKHLHTYAFSSEIAETLTHAHEPICK